MNALKYIKLLSRYQIAMHNHIRTIISWNSQHHMTAQKPAVQLLHIATGGVTTQHIPLHIFNHKVHSFIASYLADFKHFKLYCKNDWVEELFYFLTVQF